MMAPTPDCRSDPRLPGALDDLEVELLEVGGHDGGVGPAADVEGLVGVVDPGVLFLPELREALHDLELDAWVVLDHHAAGGAVLEVLELVCRDRVVGLDLPHDRREPRHSTPLRDRVGQGRPVHDLTGEEDHGREPGGGVDVGHHPGVERPRVDRVVALGILRQRTGDDLDVVGPESADAAAVFVVDVGGEEVAGQADVLLHAGEQLAGGAVGPGVVEERQAGPAVQLAGTAVDDALVGEPDLGEGEHPDEDAGEDDPVGLVGALDVALEVLVEFLADGLARPEGGHLPVPARAAERDGPADAVLAAGPQAVDRPH